MTQLEMRTLDMHYDPDEAEMSAQERLLYNNNYNSNHHHPMNGDEEPHYQLPYAHLHQSPYLHHQQQLQQQQSSYSSDDHSSIYNPRHINGNGMPYPQTTFQDKYSVAYPVRDDHIGRRGTRPTGSGIVYRPRRKLWWVAALLVLLLLVMAGAVVIAIYFTVLKKEPEPTVVADNGLVGKNKTTPRHDQGDSVTQQPPYVIYTTPYTRPHPPDFMEIKVQKFDAFWHPGDSRLFSATLTNGTIIQVFGPKKSDGTVKSIYSLGMTDSWGSTKSVRFLDQRNLASVVLPNGVIVNYDWSANNLDMEVKVFEPFTEQSKGPISHLAIVEVGIRSYLLRQISKVMADMRILKAAPLSGSRRGSHKCFTRFPLKVTKCGGQYNYDGAYVQGEISGIDKPIIVAALPWPKEPDSCYDQDMTTSNYYLPLPGKVDNDNATMIKEAYVASSARVFMELCNTINDQVFKEHNDLCSEMAEKVRTKLNRHQLLGIVYESCSAILNSLHTACVAISGISSADNMPSLTEDGLLRSFTRRLSDSFQPGLPDTVDLKAHAYCPSSQPISSFQTTAEIQPNRDNIIQDTIHINCPNYPEVTYVDVDHLLTKSDVQTSSSHYDLVKHKMRLCSICAFEKSVSAKIITDEMLCNNTCMKTNMLEHIPENYIPEEKDFVEQDSVYCHDFLTTVDNRMEPIGRQCLGSCLSHLYVQFKIKDPKTNVLYYEQTVQCSELRNHACKMKFGI
ncbi:unnamed protein product [Lymnaea stagnalis]|uniref:Uncharacterized protein n=1 Tax=Lymnaea stagnalis TaxID=6523 RepID=A0AAV2HIS2_LYMST